MPTMLTPECERQIRAFAIVAALHDDEPFDDVIDFVMEQWSVEPWDALRLVHTSYVEAKLQGKDALARFRAGEDVPSNLPDDVEEAAMAYAVRRASRDTEFDAAANVVGDQDNVVACLAEAWGIPTAHAVRIASVAYLRVAQGA